MSNLVWMVASQPLGDYWVRPAFTFLRWSVTVLVGSTWVWKLLFNLVISFFLLLYIYLFLPLHLSLFSFWFSASPSIYKSINLLQTSTNTHKQERERGRERERERERRQDKITSAHPHSFARKKQVTQHISGRQALAAHSKTLNP